VARRPRLARPALTRTVAAIATLAALSTVTVAAAPASADSLSSVRADIAAAQHQLDALDAQAEAATERYNAARIRLAADQHTADVAHRRLDRAQHVLGGLRRSVSAWAAAAYKGEGLTMTLGVSAATPQAFLDKLSTLEAVANSQQQSLAALAAAQREQEQAQAQSSAALLVQHKATAQMQAERAQVLAAAHKEQDILGRLKTREDALVQAARARAARIAAERAAAALAAREAAAAAAAQSLLTQPVTSPAVTGSGGARVAVQWAYRELGKPYVWGAAGPDTFDCSGLTQYVWAKAGIYLDHYTGSQWNEGRHVSQAELQPGDLVFFGSDLHHVGLYIGNGNMIEAPHTGANVRISPYLRSDYAGAVRPGG
jgi:cell wall-associated NlpC family hydrolase